MQHVEDETTLSKENKEYCHAILDNVRPEDWQLIASLTYSIKDDAEPILRFIELRSKIKAGIYHIDKNLVIDNMLKRFI